MASPPRSSVWDDYLAVLTERGADKERTVQDRTGPGALEAALARSEAKARTGVDSDGADDRKSSRDSPLTYDLLPSARFNPSHDEAGESGCSGEVPFFTIHRSTCSWCVNGMIEMAEKARGGGDRGG